MPYNDHRKKLLSDAKRRARKSGIDFDINYTDIYIPDKCPILGIPLRRSLFHSSDNSPTLDRKDNSQGYVLGNVWVISQLANQMKSSAKVEDLLRFGNWAVSHYVGVTFPS